MCPLSACAGRAKNVRALAGRFPSASLSATLAEPVRWCARQRTDLPIPWMGPGPTAGLGGPSSTARTAVRAQVCPPTCLPMPASTRAMSGAHSTHHLCGCCAQAGCDCDAPHGVIASAVARAVAIALPHVCAPAFPWSRVGSTGPAKRALSVIQACLGGRVNVISCP